MLCLDLLGFFIDIIAQCGCRVLQNELRESRQLASWSCSSTFRGQSVFQPCSQASQSVLAAERTVSDSASWPRTFKERFLPNPLLSSPSISEGLPCTTTTLEMRCTINEVNSDVGIRVASGEMNTRKTRKERKVSNKRRTTIGDEVEEEEEEEGVDPEAPGRSRVWSMGGVGHERKMISSRKSGEQKQRSSAGSGPRCGRGRA